MDRIKLIILFAFASIFLSSCDDNTDTIGNTLTDDTDRFEIYTDTFEVESRSIIIDSVLSKSKYNYLGHIKDSETQSYIKSEYTTQFAILESFDQSNQFPEKDSIRSFNAAGEIIADSCILQIYFYSSIGDSLNPMKLSVKELSKPIEEDKFYYTNFSPLKEDAIRNDGKGINKSKIYTVVDLNLSDSARALIVNKKNMENISISLNDIYYDKEGKKYDNYGTYILRKYYENPNFFSNSYNFTHNVCPGFYIGTTDGIGVMSEVYLTELLLFYKFESNDSIYNGSKLFSGTEEVMQTTTITNDKKSIKDLAEDNTCTYLKTPAGILTEMELPVDLIKQGHENDTISSAKIVLNHYNKSKGDIIPIPQTVMLLPKDSLYSFFENKNLPDNITSYLANYNKSQCTYTFNNISNLLSKMYNIQKAGKITENWNKVVLVPVSISYNTSSSSNTVTSVSNEMALKSVKLVGGSTNKNSPIKISVVYNKFQY